MIDLEILGKPQGKARARTYYNFKLKKYSTFTPNATVNYENWVKFNFINKYKDFDILLEPLKVEINCYFIKNRYNKAKYPTLKPDLDNIAKIILDSLNGLAYHDDKQVVDLKINKIWGDIDKVNLKIQSMEG